MVRHRQESFYDVRIKLASGEALDFLFCGLQSLLRAVRPIGGNGIERISNREDASSQGNIVSTQTTWVAGAIPFFLVRIDDVGSFGQKGNLSQHLIPVITVLSHNADFFSSERARFAQNGIRNSHLADVVQERATGDDANLVVGQPAGGSN